MNTAAAVMHVTGILADEIIDGHFGCSDDVMRVCRRCMMPPYNLTSILFRNDAQNDICIYT